jgi:ElaB/YqjD/DUF883 family membrane-anchored ribosome-binding protein
MSERERTNGRRARQLAEDLSAAARERAERVYESAREGAEHVYDAAREQAEEAYGVVQDGIDEAHTYLKRQFRQRPLTVAATAVGLGLIIGLALSRGGRR